ncbi:MAG: UDPglucose 6-dehydrogenase, partial [Bacteroidia bacterium]
AIWGLAFKPNTDDIREAPALYNIDLLIEAGAEITAFDPEAMDNVKALYGDKIKFANNQNEAIENCDALLICTEWQVFRTPDFERLSAGISTKAIFDGRNLYDTLEMKEKGFNYFSIGR